MCLGGGGGGGVVKPYHIDVQRLILTVPPLFNCDYSPSPTWGLWHVQLMISYHCFVHSVIHGYLTTHTMQHHNYGHYSLLPCIIFLQKPFWSSISRCRGSPRW